MQVFSTQFQVVHQIPLNEVRAKLFRLVTRDIPSFLGPSDGLIDVVGSSAAHDAAADGKPYAGHGYAAIAGYILGEEAVVSNVEEFTGILWSSTSSDLGAARRMNGREKRLPLCAMSLRLEGQISGDSKKQ